MNQNVNCNVNNDVYLTDLFISVFNDICSVYIDDDDAAEALIN